MDKLIESFEEFVDGANRVELCYDAETAGVTRVVVSTPQCEVRRLGFARRAAAEEALANMRSALDEEGYGLESKTRRFDKLGIAGIWTIHEVYSRQD